MYTVRYTWEGFTVSYKTGGNFLREFLRRISRLGYPLVEVIDPNGFNVTKTCSKWYDYLMW